MSNTYQYHLSKNYIALFRFTNQQFSVIVTINFEEKKLKHVANLVHVIDIIISFLSSLNLEDIFLNVRYLVVQFSLIFSSNFH